MALILDPFVRVVAFPEYTHAAFSIAANDFATLDQRIRRSGAEVWQENHTEGESLYFLDPNGHKLEIHASNLKSRIGASKEKPPEGVESYT